MHYQELGVDESQWFTAVATTTMVLMLVLLARIATTLGRIPTTTSGSVPYSIAKLYPKVLKRIKQIR